MINICDVPKKDYKYKGGFFKWIFRPVKESYVLNYGSDSEILFRELENQGYNPKLIYNSYSLSDISIYWVDNNDSEMDKSHRNTLKEKLRELHNQVGY